MGSKEAKQKNSDVLLRAAAAAGLGMAVTLAALAFGAMAVYRGYAQGRGGVVAISVFLGSLISAYRLRRSTQLGYLPRTLIVAAALIALTLLISALRMQGRLVGEVFPVVLVAAFLGSAAGGLSKRGRSGRKHRHKKR